MSVKQLQAELIKLEEKRNKLKTYMVLNKGYPLVPNEWGNKGNYKLLVKDIARVKTFLCQKMRGY